GIVDQDLTTEAATGVGRAFAAHLRSHGLMGAVAVGRDNRPNGPKLRDALVEGLTSSGVDVVDIGVVPTPLLYWSLHHLEVDGGIQITGSHNPPEYNGFKICVGKESLHGDGITGLYRIIQSGAFVSGAGQVTTAALIDRYIDDIVQRVGPLSRPLRVVFDAGNGAGSLVAEQLYSRLGADGVYIFCESDGTFPNHHPDPTVVENLQDLIRAVRETGSEVGIGFDGDADRIGIVDGDGTIIWGDYLLLVYARDVLRRTGEGQAIIFDVKCSQALPDGIEKTGGKAVMWKTGHSLIKDKMKEMQAPLAGEMSGHMFFGEGFYGHDDALYGAARLLRILADSKQTVKQYLADVPRFVSTPEMRIDCPDDRKEAIVRAALAHFAARYRVSDVDGVRILFDGGWGLIRSSNTQPILVMRFEADTAERLKQIQGEVEGWMQAQGVDTTPGVGH
ncbi:MAG TPA: phosphomannomutase/phosphoglucomutase, partial [Gemmatimonadaceae bacterium]|nr:phosphomannomutase/phosphoglucomutase [Gemmatimonadaceae bacterium]